MILQSRNVSLWNILSKVLLKRFKKPQTDPYGTVRDSKAAVVSWTKSLSLKKILAIQEACKSPMRILGYRPVESSADLVNFNNSLNNLPEIDETEMWLLKSCCDYWLFVKGASDNKIDIICFLHVGLISTNNWKI